MFNLKPMNSKDMKKFMEMVNRQWGCEPELDYFFFETADRHIQIVSREFANINATNLRINSVGLYLGQIAGEDLRLSIEGSQLIGPFATKGVIKIFDDEVKGWAGGSDLISDCMDRGFVIIKHGNDFLGSGKLSNNKISNYVPKARRINAI